MGIIDFDAQTVPLSFAAKMLWLTPGHLRRLHRQGKVRLTRPGSRNFHMPLDELDRLLGRTIGERHCCRDCGRLRAT